MNISNKSMKNCFDYVLKHQATLISRQVYIMCLFIEIIIYMYAYTESNQFYNESLTVTKKQKRLAN